MRSIRRDADIFEVDGDWFHARWHFSFSNYRDPDQMGVGPLRVFNDDTVAPGAAWPMHPHQDIESLTWVVSGHFEHDDSLGNNGTFEAGAAQVMTFSHAGAQHSERNASDDEPVRFIQFWILPSAEGLPNAVQQHQFTEEERTDRWLQIMGPAGEEGLDLAQEARVHVARLTPGNGLAHSFEPDRAGYLYVIDGEVDLDDDEHLATGDAVKVELGPEKTRLTATETAELILVDVAATFEPVGIWAR